MNRRDFLRAVRLRLVAYGLPLSLLSAWGFYWEPRALVVRRQEVRIPGLPPAWEGVTIVHLSDLHYPFVSLAHIQNAVALANTINPDIIVLTGDYLDSEQPGYPPEFSQALANLQAPYGVYAVLGNHDGWRGKEKVVPMLAAAKIALLENQGVMLMRQEQGLYVAGVEDGLMGQPNIGQALSAHRPGAPVILLAHEPDLADDFAVEPRLRLQLSGHSHGGQVRIPWMGAPVLPLLGQKYSSGLYSVTPDFQVFTTHGVGMLGFPIGPPVRFNCSPEVALLRLVADAPVAQVSQAQSTLQPPPASPELRLSQRVGKPISHSYGFLVEVDLMVDNPNTQPLPELYAQWVYITATGAEILCQNRTIPTGLGGAHSRVSIAPVPAEGQTRLQGLLFIPAGWHRGEGQLRIRFYATVDGISWLKELQTPLRLY